MAKKRTRSSAPAGSPLARLHQARARGDDRGARRLAQELLDDPQSTPAARDEATGVLRALSFDPVHLALFGVGLVLWIVVFYLGVLARG